MVLSGEIVIDNITDSELNDTPGENTLETTIQTTIATIASQTQTGVVITPLDVTIDKILPDTPATNSITVDYTVTVNDASNAQIVASLISNNAAVEMTQALVDAGFDRATTSSSQTTIMDLTPTPEPTKSPSSKTKYPSPEPTGTPTNMIAVVVMHQGISGRDNTTLSYPHTPSSSHNLVPTLRHPPSLPPSHTLSLPPPPSFPPSSLRCVCGCVQC